MVETVVRKLEGLCVAEYICKNTERLCVEETICETGPVGK